jgi:kynurenine formamidase
MPIGATIVDLNHDGSTAATSWIDEDLRATLRSTRTSGAEVGFVTADGTADPRGFGANRAASETADSSVDAAAEKPRVRRLVAPLVVLDMCKRTAEDRDAELRVEDIEAFEVLNGKIGPGSALLVRTCWYWRWGNRNSYLGTSKIGGQRYHFPGVSWLAAKALTEREVAAVAIDTAGVDHGLSTGRVVQRTLEQAGIEVFVNVIAYQDLPTRGALLMALPMKIPGSARTPTRVLALTP